MDLLVNGKPLSELRVVDLREELEKRNLSKTGNKNALQTRLQEALQAEEKEEDTKSSSSPTKVETSAPVNPLVADYLARQEQILKAQQAEAAKTASSETEGNTDSAAEEQGAEEVEPRTEEEEVHPQPSPSHSAPSKDEEEQESEKEEEVESEAEAEEDQREVVDEDSLPAKEEINNDDEESMPERVVELKEEEQSEVQRQQPRKRKWGSTKKKQAIAISSDSLKDLGLPSVKEAVEETINPDTNIELDYEERVGTKDDEEDEEVAEDAENVPPARKVSRIVVEDGKAKVERPVFTEPETVTEEELNRAKSPSPPRYPKSNVIHVRCLTRPFTSGQLFALLGQYGEFDRKSDFWIDSIKSNCIVKYDNEDSAEKAREGLHNVQWPPGNPRVLRVDFATDEVFERHRTTEAAEPRNGTREARLTSSERRPERIERTIHRDSSPVTQDRRRRSKSPEKVYEREWDRGKGFKAGQSPPREEERKRRLSPPARSRRSREEKEAVKPAKLLEDLFKKTEAQPCIYWLPLTEEQAAERQVVRKKQEAERAERYPRRLEADEDRGGGGPFDRGGPAYRRDPPPPRDRPSFGGRRPRSPSPYRRR